MTVKTHGGRPTCAKSMASIFKGVKDKKDEYDHSMDSSRAGSVPFSPLEENYSISVELESVDLGNSPALFHHDSFDQTQSKLTKTEKKKIRYFI